MMMKIVTILFIMASLHGISQNISQLRPSDGPGHIPMTAAPYFRQVYTSPGVVADTLAKYMDQLCGGRHADDTLTLYLCEEEVIVDSIKFELIVAGGGGAADSMARVVLDGALMYGQDNKLPDFDTSKLFYNSSTSRLGIGTSLPDAPVHIHNSILSEIKLTNGFTGLDGGALYLTMGTTDVGTIRNTTGGNLRLTAGGGATGIGLTLLYGGQIQFNDYTDTTSFPGTEVGYLGFDADGKILSSPKPSGGGSPADGTETKVTAGTNISVTGDGSTGTPYVVNNTQAAADGSETKINAGTNVSSITGAGTIGSPYVINVAGGSSLFTDGGVTTYLTSTGDRLHLGGTSAVRKFQVTQDHDTNVGLIRIENTGEGDATYEFGAAGVYGAIGMNSSDSTIIIAHHDNIDASRAVYIDQFAKVGIGIDPDYKLDVNGSMRVRSGLYDGGGDIGTANHILRSTGSGVDWISPDTYDDQDISWNAGTRELTIDNGSTIGLTGLSLWTDGGVTSYLTSTSDRVAIGGTSASNKLHVQQHTSSNAAMIRMQNDNALGGDATLAFQANGAFGAIGMNGSDSTIIIAHHDNLDASRAVYIDPSANVGIGIDPSYRLDVNGSARLRAALYDNSGDMGGSGQVLSSTGASATNWIDLPDGSATNEIQTLSWNSGTSMLTISAAGGNTVDLSSLEGSGGDGIYGGTGDVGGGTTNVVAAIANGQYLAFDYNSGTDELYIGTNTNLYSGAQVNITSTTNTNITSINEDVTISAGSGDSDNVIISAEGETVMTIDKDYTIVNSNMLIGDNTADQLEIQTKDADNGVYMAHEDAMDADASKVDDSYIGLFENGNVVVSAGLDGALEASCFIYGHDILSLKADATVGRVGIEGAVVYTTVGSDFGVGGVPQTGYEFTTHGDALIKGDLDYEDDLMDVSDRRLKKNIGKIRDSYARVMALKPVHYKMKKSSKEEYGYIAQDYQEVFPEQTKERSDGMLSISYQSANTYTTAAVQELIQENEDMKKRIEKLEDIIKKLDK